jgi:hypothetical protein
MGGKTPTVPEAPIPTPPVTANNAASVAVEQATYRQQLRRKGIGQTVFAGSKGGYGGTGGLQGYAAGMNAPGSGGGMGGSMGGGSSSGPGMGGGGGSYQPNPGTTAGGRLA